MPREELLLLLLVVVAVVVMVLKGAAESSSSRGIGARLERDDVEVREARLSGLNGEDVEGAHDGQPQPVKQKVVLADWCGGEGWCEEQGQIEGKDQRGVSQQQL